MPFECLEQFMISAFLIKLTQLEKTRSTGKVFIPLEIIKLNSTFQTKIVHEFLRHFYLRCIWRVLFTQLSADEFQLNSESAYIPKSIHKCINV